MQIENSYEQKTMLETNHDRILHLFEEAITVNPSLTEEKENLVEIFDNMLYNAMLHDIPIPFDKVIERIKTLKFTLGNRYILKEAYQYDVKKNIVQLKQDDVEEYSTYCLTSILYDLALNIEEKDKSYFDALYAGEVYNLALSTLGMEEIPPTAFDEVILYQSLKAILGEDVIANGLLTEDCALIYQTMKDYGFTNEDIQMIKNTSNYNQYGRYPKGSSSLPEVQKRIIDVFVENAQNESSTKQKMHFLKKALDISCKQLKNTNLKYGFDNLESIKEVLGDDYNVESTFTTLENYLNKKSSLCGFDELEYGKAK